MLTEDRKQLELEAMLEEREDEKERNEAMKQETVQVTTLSPDEPQSAPGPSSWGGSRDGTQMVTWQQPDGFYGCLQGVFERNAFEGEDQGPYPTREAIEEELRDEYENPEVDEDLSPEEVVLDEEM